MRSKVGSLVAIGLACWIAIIVASGLGWNPFGVAWNFENSGSFGDSFGPLGAIMAGFAALAAFATLQEQSKQFERIIEREEAEDTRRADQDASTERQRRLRQASESRQLFEQTFFKMLEALREIVKEIDVGTGENRKQSRDAFQALVSKLRRRISSSPDLCATWLQLANEYKNDLNHYFRFLYHIVVYVDLQESVDRYSYVRLLRASLSEAELVLLALNCSVGEGVEKFKPLIEKYALLHNLSVEAKTAWALSDKFDRSAFDREE